MGKITKEESTDLKKYAKSLLEYYKNNISYNPIDINSYSLNKGNYPKELVDLEKVVYSCSFNKGNFVSLYNNIIKSITNNKEQSDQGLEDILSSINTDILKDQLLKSNPIGLSKSQRCFNKEVQSFRLRGLKSLCKNCIVSKDSTIYQPILYVEDKSVEFSGDPSSYSKNNHTRNASLVARKERPSAIDTTEVGLRARPTRDWLNGKPSQYRFENIAVPHAPSNLPTKRLPSVDSHPPSNLPTKRLPSVDSSEKKTTAVSSQRKHTSSSHVQREIERRSKPKDSCCVVQ